MNETNPFGFSQYLSFLANMRSFSCLWLILLAWPIWAQGIVIPGKSGIDAIDTLPTYEWDIPTLHKSLGLTLAFGMLPGGAQFYTQHYIRGGFLVAIEGGLAYEVFVNKPSQQRKRRTESAAARDSILLFTDSLLSSGVYSEDWVEGRQRSLTILRSNNDIKIKEEDLRRSELAWLIGLHLYGIMDGYGIWKHNQGRSIEQRRVVDAVWRAALVPGWGQLYNDEYGKAGLLYMAIIGGSVSLWSRQGVVDYLEERRDAAELEGDYGEDELDQLDEDILFYRKKRNQYIWGLALFYLYSIADAAVDAALSDFDNPLYWAMVPSSDGRGLGVEAGIHF